jgi:hypothetical protein
VIFVLGRLVVDISFTCCISIRAVAAEQLVIHDYRHKLLSHYMMPIINADWRITK